VSRLYADVLGIVFSFLPLYDLDAGLPVSSFWSGGVAGMPRRSLPLCLSGSQSWLPPRALRWHIGSLQVRLMHVEAHTIARVDTSFRHLHTLDACMIVGAAPAGMQVTSAFRLPRGLRILKLEA
jgi:hypothetical protein